MRKVKFYKEYKEFDNIRELLKYSSTTFPDHIAYKYRVKGGYGQKTFKETWEEVNNLTAKLVKEGLTSQKISIVGPPTYELIAAFFAVMNAGSTAILLDKALSDEDIVGKIDFTDSTVLIYDNEYAGVKSICGDRIRCISVDEIKKELDNYDNVKDFTLNEIDSDSIAAFAFTSGTTSVGKAAMFTHKNIVSNAADCGISPDFLEGTMLLVSPLSNLNSTCQLVAAHYAGATIAINDSVKNLMKNMKVFQPTLLMTVPLIVDTVYRNIQKELKKKNKLTTVNIMRYVCRVLKYCGIDIRKKVFAELLDVFGGKLGTLIIGGAPMNIDEMIFFQDLGINMLQGYGLTECSPTVSANMVGNQKMDSIGYVLPYNEVRIVDDEIQVRGRNIMQGYYKNEKATQEAFDGDWFKTGDIGSLDKDNFLYIKGRIKNLIILKNGVNVSPEVLEQEIEKLDVVQEVVVKEKDGKICAEIYMDHDLDMTLEEEEKLLREQMTELNRTLPTHHNIQTIEIREEPFERNVLCKVKRK